MPRNRVSSTKNKNLKNVKEEEKPIIINNALKVFDVAKHSNKMLGIFASSAAIYRAISVGGRSCALFLKNRRRYYSPPYDNSIIKQWFDTIKKTNFSLDLIVPHGTYFLNPASLEPLIFEKSRENMLDDCYRCEQLGISLYCFHPGSTLGMWTKEEGIEKVAEVINYIHLKTKFVTLLIENMAGSGYTLGGDFKELGDIIAKVNNKNRVGVCIDTCHLFAAGYDFRTKNGYDKMIEQFDKEVGLKYLKVFHLNDSEKEFHSKVDRHANIGNGYIGLESFGFIMNDPRWDGIPMILETPPGCGYSKELLNLYLLQRSEIPKHVKMEIKEEDFDYNSTSSFTSMLKKSQIDDQKVKKEEKENVKEKKITRKIIVKKEIKDEDFF